MTDNIYYVYEWIRLDTNEPFYVGKGKENRWRTLKRNNYFNNIVKSTNAVVSILHSDLSEEEAFEYECWYINEYKHELGYSLTNMTDGGEGFAGYKITPEVRLKLSIANSGENNPASTQVILLNTLEIFNTIESAEEKYNIKGISSCCRGINYSIGKDINNIPYIWEYYDPNKIYSEEYFIKKLATIQEKKFTNLSYSKKGKFVGANSSNSKSVILLNTMEHFESISLAQKKYNIGGISNCCKGHQSYAGVSENNEPLIWRYNDERSIYDNTYINNAIKEAKEIRKGENNPNYNKPMSEENKKKISKANKGKKLSDEHKQAFCKTGVEHPMYGKKQTNESKEKMSKNRKGMCLGKDNPKARSVVCITTNRQFDTIKDALREYNLKSSSDISNVCNGKANTAGKYNGQKLQWAWNNEHE